MSIAARVSLVFAVHEHVDGPFPALRTYPSAYERRVAGGEAKVFAQSGVVPAGQTGATANVPGTLTVVHYWLVENLAPADVSGAAEVSISGAPINGTVPRGQVVLATNDAAGWPATTVTVTGTPGTPYKIIAVGE